MKHVCNIPTDFKNQGKKHFLEDILSFTFTSKTY